MSQPLCYRVRVCLPRELATDFVEWMQTHHIPTVVSNDGFLQATLYRLDEADPKEAIFSTDYLVISLDALQTYQAGPSEALKQDFKDRYGDVATVSRELFQTVAEVGSCR